jgi:hypothetical protein
MEWTRQPCCYVVSICDATGDLDMNASRRIQSLVGLSITAAVCFLIAYSATAADVDVYGEGIYSPSVLIVQIFADISTVDLSSFGVKLSYDPADLEVSGATTNEDIWYLGSDATKYPYLPPDSSVPGEVVLLGGRLDTVDPAGGVGGSRVLLGDVSFTRTPGALPTLSLSYGKPGDYKNFVATDGTILDDEPQGVEFGLVVLPEPSGQLLLLCGVAGILVIGRNRIQA